MTSNQVTLWSAVIAASCIIGLVLLVPALLSGQVLFVPLAVVFLAFGLTMVVVLRRQRRTQ